MKTIIASVITAFITSVITSVITTVTRAPGPPTTLSPSMRLLSRYGFLLLSPHAPLRTSIHPLCSSVQKASLNLFIERPVRALLDDSGPRRKIENVPLTESDSPLQSVRSALLRRMPEEALNAISVRHGKRPIETDDDLRRVLSLGMKAGHTIQLAIAPADGVEISRLPPPRGPLVSPADATVAANAVIGEAATAELSAERHQMLSFVSLMRFGAL
ncbi:MAG: hypothetical protein SGPRY_005023 [Prymnesium sp.]